jgi:putative phosphoribosyl transferase
MGLESHLPFRDRRHAGELLAGELAWLADAPRPIVLALPRGGVPVGWAVAEALHAPLEVFVVRKIALPHSPEYAVGAIASGGVQVMDPDAARLMRPQELLAVVREETEELERRELAYRGGRPLPPLCGRSVIVVDDGAATGATLEAAAHAVRKLGPLSICVAAPVGSRDAQRRLRPLVDQLVLGAAPEPFHAVSQFYQRFPQCTDQEVQALLERSGRWQAAGED